MKEVLDWILTEYNNQYDPFGFYSVGGEESGELPEEPILSNEIPEDRSIDVSLTPLLSIHVFDYQNDTMNIFFCTNASGYWETIGNNLSVGSGTYSCSNTIRHE